MTNQEAIDLNRALVNCYIFSQGITATVRLSHVELIHSTSELKLISVAEIIEAINMHAPPSNGKRQQLAHVDDRAIPPLKQWAADRLKEQSE